MRDKLGVANASSSCAEVRIMQCCSPLTTDGSSCTAMQGLPLAAASGCQAGRNSSASQLMQNISAGCTIYHGPREHVEGFFQEVGFRCPSRKGIAAFLQEVCWHMDTLGACSLLCMYMAAPAAMSCQD